MSCKRLLLTPGEPAGIGPELALRAAQKAQPYALTAVCDPALLELYASRLSLPIQINIVNDRPRPRPRPRPSKAGEIDVLALSLTSEVEPGKLDKSNAAYVLQSLKIANDSCLSGFGDALVTGPVQKSIINDAGIPFSGHTEYFAEQSHTDKVVMMLATPGLRVALATTHLPLREVADAITQDELEKIILILDKSLREQFGLAQPRILVCGLNPHAGENGHLGSEEIEVIIPTLNKLRQGGINLNGPLPADTLFTPRHLEQADAVLAMYHDQGLPVLKFKGFGNAVNITLGLPYIRSSVDHGTALDLAGKGLADTGSLFYALEQAYTLCQNSLFK